MNLSVLLYSLLGYFCGSILFTRLYSQLFHKNDASSQAADHNPGVFNAFRYGGFGDGLFSLAGDLGKGFLPVCLYLLNTPNPVVPGIALVIAAPVIGHIAPIFYRFKGGKGIAATFGSLLAIWIGQISPWPVWTLAVLFLLFKLVIPIHPDYYLTAFVFITLPLAVWFEPVSHDIFLGVLLITLAVLIRLVFSQEKRSRMEVRFLWKH